MCGIVGLYLKNKKLEPELGRLFTPMLIEMTNRGPDSAGVAIYRDPVGKDELKLTLAHTDREFRLGRRSRRRHRRCRRRHQRRTIGNHCVLTTKARRRTVRAFLATDHPGVRIVGAGRKIEIFKEVGLPKDVAEDYDLEAAHGSHIIGHTRMATESAVTTAGSHPFATGHGPLPRPQRLAVEPQPAAAMAAQARRHRVPDRERHRGRGRLSHLETARRRDA